MPSRRLGISKCSRCSSALRSTSGHSGHSKLGVSVCRASLSSRKKRVESEPPVAPRARLRSIHLTQNTKSQLLHEVTWNLEMMVSNRNLLFQGSIFRFHVCLGGFMAFKGYLFLRATFSSPSFSGFVDCQKLPTKLAV